MGGCALASGCPRRLPVSHQSGEMGRGKDMPDFKGAIQSTSGVSELKMLFARFTVDPQADLMRGFSGFANSWVSDFAEATNAVARLEAEQGLPSGNLRRRLPPPRQDRVTGDWCWAPEAGLSGFAFWTIGGVAPALASVARYGQAGMPYCVFESDDFDIGGGSDGEDIFRGGRFLGRILLPEIRGAWREASAKASSLRAEIAAAPGHDPGDMPWRIKVGPVCLRADWRVASAISCLPPTGRWATHSVATATPGGVGPD